MFLGRFMAALIIINYHWIIVKKVPVNLKEKISKKAKCKLNISYLK